jgi:hypothetical protein
MSQNRLFAIRSYDWWDPSRKRRNGAEAKAPFEHSLIFPIARRRAQEPSDGGTSP